MGYYLRPRNIRVICVAEVAELADARDSKSRGTWYHGGSTPPFGTNSERALDARSRTIGFQSAFYPQNTRAVSETVSAINQGQPTPAKIETNLLDGPEMLLPFVRIAEITCHGFYWREKSGWSAADRRKE